MNNNITSIEEALKLVQACFPFDNYMDENSGAYHNIANTIKKHLKLGSKILDFGSGPCDKTAIIQSLGYNCSAFDDLQDDWHIADNNKEKIVNFTKKFDIDFKIASNGYLPFEKESFDMVMSHDVLEHLHDSPRELLNDLVALLKPNGLLYITVPNAVNIRKRISVLFGKTNLPDFATYYWYPGQWRGHIREYVKNDLQMLCSYLGIKIEQLNGCNHMLQVLPNIVRPFYVPVTKFFPGWCDSWSLVARKPADWKDKQKLSTNEYAEVMGENNPYYQS